VFYVAVADSGWGYFFPYSLSDRCMALSYHLFAISSQVTGVTEPRLFATATVLIGLVLLVNAASISLRFYLRSRKKW
jgi:ABC-type phosphate transport system permease subunit